MGLIRMELAVLCLALTIIGILAVLAQVVLIQQRLLHGFLAGGECLGVEGHECQFFQDNGVVDSVVGVGAPGEGAARILVMP